MNYGERYLTLGLRRSKWTNNYSLRPGRESDAERDAFLQERHELKWNKLQNADCVGRRFDDFCNLNLL